MGELNLLVSSCEHINSKLQRSWEICFWCCPELNYIHLMVYWLQNHLQQQELEVMSFCITLSASHCCGGILDPSSLHLCFSLLHSFMQSSNKHKSSHLHHRARHFYEVFVLMVVQQLYLVFGRHGLVHYGQKSPLWSLLFEGPCFRNLVVCSDATLQT